MKMIFLKKRGEIDAFINEKGETYVFLLMYAFRHVRNNELCKVLN
jgi:hypothetical protein